MFSRNIIFGFSVGMSILSLFGAYWYCSAKKEAIKPAKTEVVVVSPDETYIKKWKDKFLQSFCSSSDAEKWNANVQPVFYMFDEYKSAIERSENTMEKQWKTRILFESTPKGNIVMFYDAYKRAFAYYSDIFIPYGILNACAMKYVLTFFCRDFFIDENDWPEGMTTPLLRVHLLDDKRASKESDDKFNVSNGPFARLKSNPSQKGAIHPVRKQVTYKEKMKNKIIHLGKIANFSFLKDKPTQSHRKDLGAINYRDYMGWRSPYSETHLAGT